MKILVTGGAGFIGSNVVDEFIAQGHEVVVADNLSTGHESNVNPKARFYKIDLRDPALIDIFNHERPEVVDHHAAQADVRKSVTDPLYDQDVNIRGTLNLLECARQSGVRKVIYISSGGAVYGEPVYLPCDEDHPIVPLCPYGVTKHTIEHYLYIYKLLHGMDYTVLRYGNVYGPRQDPLGEAGVVAIFTGRMLKGQLVTINGSGEQVRDFIFVQDCARANALALERGSGRIFNLGWCRATTINEIFSELKRITAYPYEAQYGPAKPGETFKIYIDNQRARRELNWQPAFPLEEGLRLTVEYFK
jgi:UDP-glucose 4-epimerase